MADLIGLQKWLDVELRDYEREIVETVYPELWGFEGKHCPTMGGLRLGLKSLVYARIDRVGKAVNYGGKATSIPLSNFGITLEEHKTAVGIAAAEWGVFDLAAEKVAAQFPQLLQNRDLVKNYREALEKSLREWMHKKALFGDQELGMAGLFSEENITVGNVKTFAATATTSNAETNNLYNVKPEELHDYFVDILGKFKEDTLLTTNATHLLITSKLMTQLSKRYRDGGNDGSPLTMLKKVFTSITEVNELKSNFLEDHGVNAAGTNKDRFILYENNPKVLMRKFHPIETTAPRLNDDQITYRTIGYCATSEVCVKQPTRIKYYEYDAA